MDNSFEVIDLTPEYAKTLLAQTDPTIQREINSRHVKYLSRLMTEDKWEMNFQAIVLDKHGNVADGRHRLKACVNANKNIKVLIARNVSKDAIKTIDTGLKRSLSNILQIHEPTLNKKYAATIASSVQILYRLHHKVLSAGGPNRETILDSKDLLDFLKRNESYVSFLEDVIFFHKQGSRLIPLSCIMAIGWVTSKVNYEVSMKYIKSLCIGSDNSKSPSYHIRNRLIKGLDNPKNKINRSNLMKLLTNGFDMELQGKEINQIFQTPKNAVFFDYDFYK